MPKEAEKQEVGNRHPKSQPEIQEAACPTQITFESCRFGWRLKHISVYVSFTVLMSVSSMSVPANGVSKHCRAGS